MTRLSLWLPAAVVVMLATACGPTLVGSWDASGHLGRADAFDLDLAFETEARGLAVYATQESGERAVPVCQIKRLETAVQFIIDTEGRTDCSTLNRPLSFKGVLGHDVIAGDIFDAAGQKVGIWRAYREDEKKTR